MCGCIKVVYFAKVVKFHLLYRFCFLDFFFFFFLHFITLSGNYRWIKHVPNDGKPNVHCKISRNFHSWYLLSKERDDAQSDFFCLTWFSLYFICNIDGEIALTMKYDYNYYQEKN